MHIQVSFIIVNYNTDKLLFNCLTSIKESISVPYEVIVVDNNSSDTSIEYCRCFFSDDRFHFIHLKDNNGFAKANNIGAETASGNILHFLNPDTLVSNKLDSDYRETIIPFPDKVYVHKLVNQDGTYENGRMVIPFLKNIFYWDFCRRKAWYWYRGASVILSSTIFYDLGQWPEDYFMYAEDMDLFYRMWIEGVPIVELNTTICHLGGGSSSGKWSTLEREVMVQRSFRKFLLKYYSKCQYRAVKFYFLFHDLLKHPSKTAFNIKAWRLLEAEP